MTLPLPPRPRPARARAVLLLALASLAAGPSGAEVRGGSFHSDSLGTSVACAVDLPASYDASSARYPVVYALHGLFEGEGFWERRGLAAKLARLRAEGDLPEMIVVAVDGGNSFFVNGPAGRYEDMVTRDLIAHVEATYRVVPERSGRALFGVSMGGYAALRIAFAHPELVAAVATHSAMLVARIPTAADGAGRWHMAAFHGAFGDPIDTGLWARNDPLEWAQRVDPAAVPSLFVDCGAEDRYGLAAGHRRLGRVLSERAIPHTLELPPGDHGYEYVRSRIGRSLRFVGERLRRAPGGPQPQ